MLLAILQAMLKFVLKFGLTLGLIFMVACTVFVIICFFHGDIRINIVRNEAEKEKR